jgi:TRAP-type mannitol/chloroaromatic compound transport system permease small subunit
MNRFAEFIDWLNATIAHGVRWLALMMVITTLVIVIMRYLFEVGAIGLQESVMYMHGALFLLAIAYGIKQDTHVRVDLVYSRFSQTRRDWVNLIGHILFLLPVAILLLVTSVPYVMASWRVLEGSAEVGGIPAIFLLKTLLPVMASLLLLQGLSQCCKTILTLHSRAQV